MDFNDISTRLKRIYSSIDERFDENVYEHIKIEISKSPMTIKASFHQDEKSADAYNKTMTVIDNLAKLKDHLKNKLSGLGEDPNLIEQEINGLRCLQILIDLSNEDKHGYPLTKSNRSGLKPQLQNVKRVLKLQGSKGKPAFFSMSTKGTFHQQNCTTVIDAEVFDQKGTKLYDIDKLIEEGLESWEEVIKKYNIT